MLEIEHLISVSIQLVTENRLQWLESEGLSNRIVAVQVCDATTVD